MQLSGNAKAHFKTLGNIAEEEFENNSAAAEMLLHEVLLERHHSLRVADPTPTLMEESLDQRGGGGLRGIKAV